MGGDGGHGVVTHVSATGRGRRAIIGMPYAVTAGGPLGFQVTATGLHPGENELVADFATLAEAESFADLMRKIDASRTYFVAPEEPS